MPNLNELFEKLEAAETIEEAKSVAAEIETAKAHNDLADAKSAILANLGASESVSAEPVAAKSVGEAAAKAVADSQWVRGEKGSASTLFKAASDTQLRPAGMAPAYTVVDPTIVEGLRRRTSVLDLFPVEVTTGAAVTYFVESTFEGGPDAVAEGAKKPQIHFADPTPVTEALKKIAVFYKESDELIEDLPRLATNLNNRGLYEFNIKKEAEVLNGSGSGAHILGLLGRSGVQTGTYTNADDIFKAMTDIQTATGFTADAVVINPADYQTLRLAKDSNLQYYGGGYFTGAYGNDGIVEQPAIWGLRTVVTPAIAQGTVLVGAFGIGGSIIQKSGVGVELANQNEDDFLYNRVTVRIEQRLALAVRYPAAFKKLTAE